MTNQYMPADKQNQDEILPDDICIAMISTGNGPDEYCGQPTASVNYCEAHAEEFGEALDEDLGFTN